MIHPPHIRLPCHGERRHVLEAARLGVNEFLTKPVSANALFQRIVSVVMKPRAMVHVDGCYRPEPRSGRIRMGLAQASQA